MRGSSAAGSFAAADPALSEETLDVVDSLGFKMMTPVQNASIPLLLTNKDVCVEVSGAAAPPADRGSEG